MREAKKSRAPIRDSPNAICVLESHSKMIDIDAGAADATAVISVVGVEVLAADGPLLAVCSLALALPTASAAPYKEPDTGTIAGEFAT